MRVRVTLYRGRSVLVTHESGEDVPGCPLGEMELYEEKGLNERFAIMANHKIALSGQIILKLFAFRTFTATVDATMGNAFSLDAIDFETNLHGSS